MGEVEFRADGDVAGITVHTASRITSLADSYQILASSVIADLLEGTGLDLEDQGSHELKGVPRSWRLFTVSPATAKN
jgi:class 3 adenylate cyclase